VGFLKKNALPHIKIQNLRTPEIGAEDYKRDDGRSLRVLVSPLEKTLAASLSNSEGKLGELREGRAYPNSRPEKLGSWGSSRRNKPKEREQIPKQGKHGEEVTALRLTGSWERRCRKAPPHWGVLDGARGVKEGDKGNVQRELHDSKPAMKDDKG